MATNVQQKKKPVKKQSLSSQLIKKKPQKMPKCIETIQGSIPIQSVHDKVNLIEVYDGCYTRSYDLANVNYQTASEDEQDLILTKWRAYLNSLGSNMELNLSIFNRNINLHQFEEEVLLKETGDGYDDFRKDMNKVITARVMEGKNGIKRDTYITLAVHTDSVKKAGDVFKRLDNDIDKHMKSIGSSAKPIKIEEKLEIIHDIYNIDNAGEFLSKTKIINSDGRIEEVNSFDIDNIRSMGLSVNDVIAPSSFIVRPDYLEVGNQFVRTLRVTEFPSILSDTFLTDLTNMPFNMIATLHIKPMSNQEADNLINQQLTFIREEKNNAQKNNIKNNVSPEMINPQIIERENETLELRGEIRENDEHLFETSLTIMIMAPTMELMQEYSDAIISECKKASATCEILKDQQEEGFISTLPLCCNMMLVPRTLKSSSCAILVPFSNLEINEADGINYTMNAVSKNLLVYNRENKANFNGFIIGSSGCVDAETEFFNGTEWKSISEYKPGEKVLQFDCDTNEASLVEPLEYIKAPCDKMYHIRMARGLDQMLSDEHRVLYRNYLWRSKSYSEIREISGKEFAEQVKKGIFHGRIQTSFDYNGTGIAFSDAEIKVMLAVIADGSFDNRWKNNKHCRIHLKKKRKIAELRKILNEAGITYRESQVSKGYTDFYFESPKREKEFYPYWFNCSNHQLKLITENILNWDGCVTRGKEFTTSSKLSADFVQFAFASQGYRASISLFERKGEVRTINGKEYERKSNLYAVNIASSNMVVPINIDKTTGINNVDVDLEDTPDGFKYCFVVPSHALVLRRNGRIFITGNSGKSFTAKCEIVNVFLKKNADIMILDPEQEYVYTTTALGGQVIPIMPGGKYHINPLDISPNYEFDGGGEDGAEIVDPILEKVSFITQLFESMIGKAWGIDSIQKTLIDECLRDLYKKFMKDGRLFRAPAPEETPTLNDMMEWFGKCKIPEARELYFTLKRYAGNGSLNVFSQTTNVQIHNRIVCFDISAIGDELKLMGMNIIQDMIWSRLVENRRIGKFTYIYCDEIHIYFQAGNESAAAFLCNLYKRARKYGGVPTGITQNPADMLDHDLGKKMLSEANFIQVLNQQSDESRARLKDILNLSESSLDFITSAPPGQGLLYTGSSTVPFYSKFPKINADGTPNAIFPLLTSSMKDLQEIKEKERRAKLKAEQDAKKAQYV